MFGLRYYDRPPILMPQSKSMGKKKAGNINGLNIMPMPTKKIEIKPKTNVGPQRPTKNMDVKKS